MSESLFRFAVAEIPTLRVTCRSCAIIVEWPVEKIATAKDWVEWPAEKIAVARDWLSCPSCGASFDPNGTMRDPVRLLAASLLELRSLDEKTVRVEITMPTK